VIIIVSGDGRVGVDWMGINRLDQVDVDPRGRGDCPHASDAWRPVPGGPALGPAPARRRSRVDKNARAVTMRMQRGYKT
jgi:hypothetical protein